MAVSAQQASFARAVARFAQATVAYNVAVILWGAYVRATGSGAGCGGHWPLCNGSVIPETTQSQTLIEFIHRVTSGISLVLMAVLLIWVWRKTAKGDWPRRSAVIAAILLLNEAILGALLVLLDYVGLDHSVGRVVFLCLHFGNTLLLLAALSVTALWLSRGTRRFALKPDRVEKIIVAAGLLSVVLIGITGSLAALGDTLFPALSLRNSLQQDFSASTNALVRLRLLHPFAAVLGVAYILWVAHRFMSNHDRVPRLLWLILSTLAAQVALGVLNVLFLAPVNLQIAHLFFADILWILLVVASTELLFAPAGLPAGPETAPTSTEPSERSQIGLVNPG
jgi:heme A synthase